MNPEKRGINMGLKRELKKETLESSAQCRLNNLKNLLFKSSCTKRYVN